MHTGNTVMTNKYQAKARRIRLICTHDIWLKAPYPNLKDKLWCTTCDDYQEVGPGLAATQAMWHDGWYSEPIKGRTGYVEKLLGMCLTEECGYRSHGANFYQLEARMWSHVTHMHSNSSLLAAGQVEIPERKRLPSGSEPPF